MNFIDYYVPLYAELFPSVFSKPPTRIHADAACPQLQGQVQGLFSSNIMSSLTWASGD